MNKTIYILLLLIFTGVLYAQDRIITTDGDTINCKILKENNEYTNIIFFYEGEQRRTLIPNENIISLEKDYFENSEIKYTPKHKEYQPFRLSIDAGWGRRIGKTTGGNNIETAYLNKLKSGYVITASAAWFFSEQLGAGLEYSLFKTSHSSFGANDNINIHFIGPQFIGRLYSPTKKSAFIFSWALGYIMMADRGSLDGIKLKMKGGTIGSILTIGYDIGISKNIAFGVKLGLNGGALSKYTITSNGKEYEVSLEENQRESLVHLYINAGLRFNI